MMQRSSGLDTNDKANLGTQQAGRFLNVYGRFQFVPAPVGGVPLAHGKSATTRSLAHGKPMRSEGTPIANFPTTTHKMEVAIW